jgi:predicted lipoprotein with Yx(FWY)xxD motif
MFRTIRQRSGFAAVGVAAALALAACGSSAKATVSPGAQPEAGSTSTSAAPSAKTNGSASTAVVKTSTNAKFGSILVDAKGMTLYTLTNAGAPVACTGQCATFWPPLMVPTGATSAVGAAGVSGLGTAMETGGNQVTDNGDPLYRFSMDKAPGDAKGDALASFGGVWHVVSATAKSSTAPSVPAAVTTVPAATPTTTSSGGYGY